MLHIYHMRPKACKGCRELRQAVVKSGRDGPHCPANDSPTAGRVPGVSSDVKSYTCKFSPAFGLEHDGFLRIPLK